MRYFFLLIFCLYGSFDSSGQNSIEIDSFIIRQNTEPQFLGEVLRKEGNQHLVQGNYDLAENYYETALIYFTKYSDSSGIGNVLSNKGSLAKRRGDELQALRYFHDALILFEIIEERKGELIVNTNLAGMFYSQKDYAIAIEHYYKAELLLMTYNDPKRTANVKMGVGNILATKEYRGYDVQKAHKAFLEALSIYTTIEDSLNISRSYNNIARLYSSQDKLDEAYTNYQKGLDVYQNIGDKRGQVIANLNIGSILKKQGELEESLQFFQAGEKLATEIGDANNYLHLLSNLVDVTAALNSIDTMTIYLNKYKALKDSLFNKEKQQQISELQTLYETEQKEKLLVAEQQLNEEKTTQNRWLIVLAIALFVAIVVTFILNKRRKLALITNAQKESKIAALNAHIVGQEKERERIASDLHDRIGSMLNNMKMMHSQYAHQGGDLGAKVEEELASTSKTIREVSHDLASATLKRHGLVTATHQLFDAINSAGAVRAKLITKGLENRFPPAIERVIDFCVRELVNNTLKYANATQIELQYLVNEDVLHLSFEDDGVGFDVNSIDYGIGLISIEARVTSVGGELTITSDPGDGVIVGIEVSVTADKS